MFLPIYHGQVRETMSAHWTLRPFVCRTAGSLRTFAGDLFPLRCSSTPSSLSVVPEVALMNEDVGRWSRSLFLCSLLRVWNFSHCKIRCHSLAVAALTPFKAPYSILHAPPRGSVVPYIPRGRESQRHPFVHSEINELGRRRAID